MLPADSQTLNHPQFNHALRVSSDAIIHFQWQVEAA